MKSGERRPTPGATQRAQASSRAPLSRRTAALATNRAASDSQAAPRSRGADFVNVPVFEPTAPAAVECTLKVGSATGPREREADEIADRIMAGDQGSAPVAVSGRPGVREGSADEVERACASWETEKEAAAKRLPEDDETIGAKLRGPAVPIGPGRERQIRGLSGGRPLPDSERSFFETRFGRDFGDVRVHTGADAQSSVGALNARAYTYRNSMVFGAGQFAPGTTSGRWLMAHELAHVVQQRATGEPGFIERDLATSPPAKAPDPQDELSADDIRKAIDYNKRRYNAPSIRLIQDLVGTKPTGTMIDADILAIARIQEAYGYEKDGMVGTKFFKFLDDELSAEKVSTDDKHCLTSLNIRRGTENIVPRANGADMSRTFFMDAQLPSHCDCTDYEYRQFIRGHFTHERAGVVTDEGDWFARLPAGRLNAAWQEDGHTGAAALNYGHRTQPAEAINRYLDDSFAVDMADGCLYRGSDTPGGNYGGWHAAPITGDILDIDVNFRGEIQRNGRVVRQKSWSGLRRRFPLP